MRKRGRESEIDQIGSCLKKGVCLMPLPEREKGLDRIGYDTLHDNTDDFVSICQSGAT
jgi:hypothetical protein